MYVVRRAFRNNGNMILPGSVVEPGSIKRFKTRLKDRDIIEVTPHTFKSWNSYFVQKFNVKLPTIVDSEAPKRAVVTANATHTIAEKVTAKSEKPKVVVATIKK